MTLKSLAQRLVQFKTTQEHPEQIKACLEFCKNFFDGLPVVFHEYKSNGIPSLIIQTQDTKTVDVILLGHIDTIEGKPELFEGSIEGGKLIGRATLDMKAFVATSLFVLKELLEEGYDGNIALALVADEEQGGKEGTGYLVNTQGYKAKVVLVPDDGESLHRIVTITKHILFLEFIALGKEAHGSRPWNGVNAIELLMHTYQQLREHFAGFDSEPADIWVNTINLGKIEGGIATNEVPGEAKMSIDIRVTDKTTREEVIEWIESSLADGVTYSILSEAVPTRVSEDDPLLQAYQKEIEAVTGKQAELVRNGGGTDGRYFVAQGMKIIVHQGNGGACQTDDEYVELDSLPQLVQIQKSFIKNNFS